MRDIRNLEIHVVHSCNLACESCSHYSNQHHKGMVGLEEADRWMAGWSKRINPAVFSLLGGEPTIHPHLPEFIPLVRKHWPKTQIRLVTNGFFLHRHPELPKVINADPDTWLYVSIHHESVEYREKILPIMQFVDDWNMQHGVRVSYYHSYRYWTQRYKGFGSQMEPFDDQQPRKSWEICGARYCPQLFEGSIYKCGQLAYLKMQDEKYHLSEKWSHYLQYEPLRTGCSDAELNEFFDREEESYCGMCPSRLVKFNLPIPLPSKRKAQAEYGSPTDF